MSKLAEFLVAEGVVDDISLEGLRTLLREEGVSFQRIKTWKSSKDPGYEAKKARIGHLYAIAAARCSPAPVRHVALEGTGHASHREQASMIRRSIIWRNNHAYDERLRRVATRANVA